MSRCDNVGITSWEPLPRAEAGVRVAGFTPGLEAPEAEVQVGRGRRKRWQWGSSRTGPGEMSGARLQLGKVAQG